MKDLIKQANLWEHQQEALLRMKNGCILKGGVGSGKSLTAGAYYMLHEQPKDLYVITTAKKRDSQDWNNEMIKFRISRAPELTQYGVLTVDSWNNISKYTEIQDAFFIFDEQRLVGSGAWVKSFYKIAKKNNWIMLSATPGDTWMDYVPVFVANGFYKNKTDFTRKHVIYKHHVRYPQIDRYIGTGLLNKHRRALLVDMDFKRQTLRHDHLIKTNYKKDLLKILTKDRWNFYEERPIENASELFRLMRFLVNTDESRLDKLDEIYDEHPKLIIFYNFNYELALLREWGKTKPAEVAEWNGHKHEDLPTSDSWIYLVQYTAGAEGWNCTTTDAMVLYSQNYSYRLTEQAKGRIDRLNTPFVDLHYYIMKSSSGIDNAIYKALSQKKTFNENDATTEFWSSGKI